MSASEHQLVDVLKQSGAKFESEAKKDLMMALEAFPDLQPTLAHHQFPDNSSRLCCTLSGTVPVKYRGSTYHIPVSLYLLDNHPYSGPYCYVSPTANMRIRSSNSVDDRGRIYLPYLTEWRYPSSDTLGLLQVMVIIFQEKCPVFSVSGSSSASGGGTTGSGSATGSTTHPTPYPSAVSGAAIGSGVGYHMPTPNAGGYQPPPYPTNSNLPPYPIIATHPNPQQPHSATIGMPQPNVNVSSYGSRGSLNTLGGGGASAGGVGGTGSGYYPAGGKTGTIQSTHIHASLLSAVEDKIRQKLTDKIGTPFAELQSIDINLQELRSNQQKLREESERMAAEQKQLEAAKALYNEKKLELEKALEACSAANGQQLTGASVEDAVDASTPLHRQIVRHYVHDLATDDMIYTLGRALHSGLINLQVRRFGCIDGIERLDLKRDSIQTYLKVVRQLSRQQFIHRATMQKCRLRAQLPI